MSLQSALERLATYRANNTRASQDIFRNGLLVLQKSGFKKLGDDGKPFRSRPRLLFELKSFWCSRSLDIPRTIGISLNRRRTTRYSRCVSFSAVLSTYLTLSSTPFLYSNASSSLPTISPTPHVSTVS